LLEPLFALAGVTSQELIHAVSFFFAFFVISFLHIVVGELAPKSMAIRMPERVSLWTAPPLYAFYWIMFPAIWVLNASSNKVLHWLGLDVVHGSDAHYSGRAALILRGGHETNAGSDEWSLMAQALISADWKSRT
jgi:CBS domain containing-hemolysin-like protein